MGNIDQGREGDDDKKDKKPVEQPSWLEVGPQPGKTAGENPVADNSLRDKLMATSEPTQPPSELDSKRAINPAPQEIKRPDEMPFLPNKFKNTVKSETMTFLKAPFNEYILALDKVLPELETARREKRHEKMGRKSIFKSFIRFAREKVNFRSGTSKLPPLKFTENEHSKEIAKLFATEICAHPTNRSDVIIALKDILKRIFEGILEKEGIEKFAGEIRPFMETQFRGLLGEIADALSWPNFEVPKNKGNLTLKDLHNWLVSQKDTLRLFS